MANRVEDIKKAKDGLDVWPDLLRYSRLGYAAIPPDDMSRLRWYGIYEQQPRNGHFMLRVKIPGGDISSLQWRALGEIARDYGRDLADITTRQNIQFHWITVEALPEIIEKMNAVGLTTVGACGDITRNVAGCPVAGLDPDEIFDCRPIVEEITRHFLGNRDFSDLPRKYKITIGGCRHRCFQPEINDVGISAVLREAPHGKRRHSGAGGGELAVASGEVGFHVRVGGGLSTQPRLSEQLDMFVKPEQVAAVCVAITGIFRDYGYRERRNHARLKFLVADWGPARFREVLVERLGWNPEPAAQWAEPRRQAADHMGVHAQSQAGLFWIGAPVLAGRLDSRAMLAAADIAERFSGGSLRTTNQQNLLFPNIPADDLEHAKVAIRASGFHWAASHLHRLAVACTGSEFCNLAITETKERLREIVSHLERASVIDEPIRINLNGCPNSCGQHHIGDIGLQGCLARVDGIQVEAYDICLGGRLGSDARFTRPIERKVPAARVKHALENLLKEFQTRRIGDEDFSTFVDRHTDEELGGFLGRHLLAEADPGFAPPPLRHAPAGCG